MTPQRIDAAVLVRRTARAAVSTQADDAYIDRTFACVGIMGGLLLFQFVIVVVILVPVESLASAAGLRKPAKRCQVLCNLDPPRQRQVVLQYLGLWTIERFHDAGSFRKRIFRNRRVPV